MTLNEAMTEMRYSGVEEEDIEAVIETCKKKGITPQNLDKELQSRGYDAVFSFEYDEYESWYEGGSGDSSHKSSGKQNLSRND
ncbi:MAG: hypothetical protein PHN38_07450 [Sulfurospirillaceae bacterium]|nr:hypothetical protein [Sulfurospirillaceae bacterium]MDD3463575.1 hypothetical protein [Sulfurospirillaceae bacterium]